jgi:hypothetical protein
MGEREEKIRQRLFPNQRTFDPSQGGFAALPFVMRRLMYCFEPRSWQVYTYVLMRIGPSGIGWLTFSEMAWDLDFKSLSKLKLYVSTLVERGWLLHSSSRSREYFLAPNPVDVIRGLHEREALPPERIEAIDELLTYLGQPALDASPGQSDESDEGDTPLPRRRRRT